MMTLNEEIEWWTKRAFGNETDAALIAFGVATGLKLARADYGAKNDHAIQRPNRATDPIRRRIDRHRGLEP